VDYALIESLYVLIMFLFNCVNAWLMCHFIYDDVYLWCFLLCCNGLNIQKIFTYYTSLFIVVTEGTFQRETSSQPLIPPDPF
jgi:hypothetical protein